MLYRSLLLEEQALASYFTDVLNTWTTRVTYTEDTNCDTAIFPLLHKSLRDRAGRESHEGEANGARSPTMSSLRRVYKAFSIQTLNFFPHTLWNILANTPGQRTGNWLYELRTFIIVIEDIHWEWTCIWSSGPGNMSTYLESHPRPSHCVRSSVVVSTLPTDVLMILY